MTLDEIKKAIDLGTIIENKSLYNSEIVQLNYM